MDTSYKNCEAKIIHWVVVIFWAAFWFMNVVDKFIGGKMYLFVGKDRFAQFLKFFSSVGVENPTVSIIALVVGTVIEIFAFVFLASSIYHLLKKRGQEARTMFFWGTITGLIAFSYFAIGDQIFGDRFELLEHTLFWVAILVSLGVYEHFPIEGKIDKTCAGVFPKAFKATVGSAILISLIGSFIISHAAIKSLEYRSKVIVPKDVGEGVYRFDIPFLANRGVWEESLTEFLASHPGVTILDIYTTPSPLTNKADNAVIYIITDSGRPQETKLSR